MILTFVFALHGAVVLTLAAAERLVHVLAGWRDAKDRLGFTALHYERRPAHLHRRDGAHAATRQTKPEQNLS